MSFSFKRAWGSGPRGRGALLPASQDTQVIGGAGRGCSWPGPALLEQRGRGLPTSTASPARPLPAHRARFFEAVDGKQLRRALLEQGLTEAAATVEADIEQQRVVRRSSPIQLPARRHEKERTRATD